ncbi:hypothetical protein SAMN05421823_10539 [Catalinimonas alkaloidigena]|uniref:Adhesin domain-containing protein n=1 Tax=Catalinimonas alkaloidigena TaxID=1075417 RepID=A0A1G9ILN0_9BACT|nr:hypothetical protein [Catalinimonas alkaloidigena]SDL25985.1 hypothetical protein SAMN05421823_10539 [Catalinimonas alkaloidigena]
MRFLLLTSLLLGLSFAGRAQRRVEKQLPLTSGQALRLKLELADSIVVKTWDRPEAQVIALVSINDGQDDDAYALNTETTPDTVAFVADIPDLDSLARPLPDKTSHKVMYSRRNGQAWGVTVDIRYEVFLPKGVPLALETINGSLVIPPTGAPLRVHSISGKVDLFVPRNQGTDVTAKTVMGVLYTDFPFEPVREDGLYRIAGQENALTINGGGIPLTLETVTGDVLIHQY